MMIFRAGALAVLLASLALPAMAAGDADKGKKVFNKCKACHAVGEKAKNKVGPMLNGIVGAEIAAVDGYKYSKAFIAKKGQLTWTEAELDTYLTKPKDHTPGTKMSFAGLRKEEDRANVIAYLKGF